MLLGLLPAAVNEKLRGWPLEAIGEDDVFEVPVFDEPLYSRPDNRWFVSSKRILCGPCRVVNARFMSCSPRPVLVSFARDDGATLAQWHIAPHSLIEQLLSSEREIVIPSGNRLHVRTNDTPDEVASVLTYQKIEPVDSRNQSAIIPA